MTDEVVIDASVLEEIVFESTETDEEMLLTSDGVFLLGAPNAVNSVNGKTGAVVLTAADVSADPAGAAAAVGVAKADQTALDALTVVVGEKADASDVAQQIADLVGTDAQVLAAIQEIGAALAEDQDLLDALEYTVANRVRFDVNNQALTALQKSNARTNIGAEEIGVAALLIAQITAASIGAATAAQGAKADTALQAADAAALQAQITALVSRNKVPPVAGRYYTNCNLGVTFSSSSVAAGQLRTTFFEPLADMTIDQIGVFLTAAPAVGARIKLAVYEFDPANANSLLLVHSVLEIVADATIGAKLVAASFTFRLGRFYAITHLSDSALAMRNFSASAGLAAGLATVDATAPITLWIATGVAYSATAPAALNLATFGTLTSNTTLIVMRAA